MRPNRPVLLALVVVLSVTLSQTALAAGTALATDTRVGADESLAPAPDRVTVGRETAAPGPARAAITNAGTVTAVVRNETNTTNYLTVGDGAVERERFANGSLDVGSALAADAHRLQQRQRSLAFERTFERAPDRAARIALVRTETSHIEARIGALERRQQRALAAFNDGSIDGRRLLRRLIAVHVEARQLRERLRTVRDVSQRTVGFRIPNDLLTRIDNVRAELAPLHGNLRAHAGRVLAGERNTTSVYVLTSSDGVVLAANDGRRFLREAYLADRRLSGAPDRFEDGTLPRISVANQRAAELYPWVYSIPAPPSIRAFGNSSVYNVSDTHPHGKLIAYLDGATADVYREIQVKRLDALPTHNRTATNGTVRLAVDRTHATGPMRLSVTDADTGDSVDATVAVNGQPVGTTGDDGTLWTVTPHDTVRITVRTPGAVVRTRFSAR